MECHYLDTILSQEDNMLSNREMVVLELVLWAGGDLPEVPMFLGPWVDAYGWDIGPEDASWGEDEAYWMWCDEQYWLDGEEV